MMTVHRIIRGTTPDATARALEPLIMEAAALLKRGPEGRGADEVTDDSLNRRGLVPLIRALEQRTARVVWMGDSKSEGQGATFTHERTLDQVCTMMRSRYNLTADGGRGYVPAFYAIMFEPSDKPTIVGSAIKVTNGTGLGNRMVHLEAGSRVEFPAMTWATNVPILVNYSTQPGGGALEVVWSDGTVIATTPTHATFEESRQLSVNPKASGSHAVTVRAASDGGAVRVEGIINRTATTGVAVYDAALSGSSVGVFTDGQAHAGAPDSDIHHWAQVKRLDPHLIVAAFGANDMSVTGGKTPDQFEQNVRNLVARRDQETPDAGLLFIMSAQGTGENDTEDRHRKFERAARDALAGAPRASIMYESNLWKPRAGFTYGWGNDPDGWLSDTVHLAPFGMKLLANAVLEEIEDLRQGDTVPGGPHTHTSADLPPLVERDTATGRLYWTGA